MKNKKIQLVMDSSATHMVGDGFRVQTFFPNEKIGMKRMSPFLLLDYNAKVEFAPRDEPRGVGVHPHRGFETVTIAYSGSVAHHDSAGNAGVVNPGEIQWMTAGSGILHKEYHEEKFSKAGGIFQMVQLWVNLPKKDKSNAPGYQTITANDYGIYELPDGGGIVEVIAGELNGVKGPVKTHSPINMYNIKIKKGNELTFELSSNWNSAALVVEGSATINEADVPADSLLIFENEGEQVRIFAKEDSTILVLSGEPIDEPIAAYGPFVMNTHDELEQAYLDYNAGKYGVLE